MYEEALIYTLTLSLGTYLSDILARTIVVEGVKRKANKGNIPESILNAIFHPIRTEEETLQLERRINENETGYRIPSF